MKKKLVILFWLVLGLLFTYLLGTWIFNVEIKGIAIDKGAAYASMFGWMATIFAAGVAAYLFNDWKEQHNQSIDSKYYDQALESFKKISITIRKLKVLYDDCKDLNDKNDYIDILIFRDNYRTVQKELNQNLDNFHGELIFLQAMSKEESSNKIDNIFQIFIKPMKQKLQECSILEKDYAITNSDQVIEHDLEEISLKVGKVSTDNFKEIVKYLSSKIKAK